MSNSNSDSFLWQTPQQTHVQFRPICFVFLNHNNSSYFVNCLYCRLLKACGSRLTEKLLEGAPTEDTLVLIERQTGKMNTHFV